ncbi:hypothetical protein BDF19DRAFT_438877 [Syncephalis fuscata]|nr:hypothetical protein BDF19DRAFT_438877 [Syncephalis fuscata]
MSKATVNRPTLSITTQWNKKTELQEKNQHYENMSFRQELALVNDAMNREREAELAEDAPENQDNLVTHIVARKEDQQRNMERRARSPTPEDINPAEDYINEELSEALASGQPPDSFATTLSIISKYEANQQINGNNMATTPPRSDSDGNSNSSNNNNCNGFDNGNEIRQYGWKNILLFNSLATFTKAKRNKYFRTMNEPMTPTKADFSQQSIESLHSSNFSSTISHAGTDMAGQMPPLSPIHQYKVRPIDTAENNIFAIADDSLADTTTISAMEALSFWPDTPASPPPLSPYFIDTAIDTELIASTARPVRIVIIGGSFAGLSVAKELDRQAERYNLHITIIDPRENLFCNVAFLRACLIDMGRLCFLNPDKAFTSGRVHRCRTRVLHLEKHHVVLEPWSKESLEQHANRNTVNGINYDAEGRPLEPPPTILPFDYAVIAAGSQYPSPMKFSTESVEEAMLEQTRVREAIQRSGRILIVGGGPSGVELATEIKYYHPSKNVTLVHYADYLIQGAAVRRKLQLRVEKTLKKMGVNLRLHERVLLTEAQRMSGWIEGTRRYTTNQGEFIETDLLFVCTGNVRYNTRLVEKLASNTIEEVISRTGEIHVLPTLQLVPYPHIFAIGDCADASPIKLATAAFDQARFCARNIRRMVRHRQEYQRQLPARSRVDSLLCIGDSQIQSQIDAEDKKGYEHVDEMAKLARYKPVPKFVLSLGPEDGTGQWPYIGILPSWFACRHKSKRLMLGQIYRFFNADLPAKSQTC